MKKLKFMAAALVLSSNLIPTQVFAQTEPEPETENVYPFGVEEKNFRSLNEEFAYSLKDLENLNQYEIELSLKNEDTGQVYVSGTILGDSKYGDLKIDLEYMTYNEEGELQMVHPLRFIVYDNFELVYFNQIELLNSLGAFSQEEMPAEVERHMMNYIDHYTVLDASELNNLDLREEVLDSLLFTPNESELLKLSDDSLRKVGDTYIMSLESVDIPAGLFNQLANFNLQLAMDFGGEYIDSDSNIWQTESTQRLFLDQKNHGISVGFRVNSNFNSGLERFAKSVSGSSFKIKTDPAKEGITQASLELNSHMSTDRMTNVSVSYNPAKLDYSVSVVGIYEDIILDIFGKDIASFDNPYYRFDYRIRPARASFEPAVNLKRITNQEFKYIIDSLINY